MKKSWEELLFELPRQRTQTLPALHLLHENLGFLSSKGIEAIAKWLHLQPSELYAVATSYTEFKWTPQDPKTINICQGLSCQLAGSKVLANSLRDKEFLVIDQQCQFMCDKAPVVEQNGTPFEWTEQGTADSTTFKNTSIHSSKLVGNAMLSPLIEGQARRLLSRFSEKNSPGIETAIAAGAYEGLAIARDMTPESGLELVKESGLRGRGGAYFPVYLKWESAKKSASTNGTPFLVVNAEEGEPGVFKDRALMENNPHQLLEGITIAAHVIGTKQVYCFINGQAHLSANRMLKAIDEATDSGFIGPNTGVTIEIRRGAGGYVCGEETVILESIEGKRAVPRLRPPFPTESGLWNQPTVINNVETLCNLPDLFRNGSSWFREVGLEDAPGTKLISLSGAVSRPGMLEVPMGTSIAEILRLGGASEVPAITLGGPSGGFLPASKFDTCIHPGMIEESGAVLGAGGIVAIDENFPMQDIVLIQANYNAIESCGKCTPCREGGERLAAALKQLRDGNNSTNTLRDIDELLGLMRTASLCGLGQMAPNPITSALENFPQAIRTLE